MSDLVERLREIKRLADLGGADITYIHVLTLGKVIAALDAQPVGRVAELEAKVAQYEHWAPYLARTESASTDAGQLGRNHYAWFMPADPTAAVAEYLDDFEAKMTEALADPFVHDMAQSVLPLIAAYRAALASEPQP